MGKYVILSDLHIHNYKQFNKNGERLDNCLSVLKDAFELCKEIGGEAILFPGDLYDSQKSIPTEVVNRTINMFDDLFLEYPDILFIAISGNHDYASKNLLTKPAITALTHLAEIYSHFMLIDNDTFSIEAGVTISGIPYYEYSNHYHAALDNMIEGVNTENHNILMIHQTPDNISDTSIPADTDPEYEAYNHFTDIFCGHIHQRQRLTDKFLVVGSPLHRDQGDLGEEKGLLIYDTDDRSVKFYPLDYPRYLILPEDEIGENTQDFVIPMVNIDVVENDQNIDTSKFNTSLKSKEILKNYWEDVDGEDTDLLEVGLSFLN